MSFSSTDKRKFSHFISSIGIRHLYTATERAKKAQETVGFLAYIMIGYVMILKELYEAYKYTPGITSFNIDLVALINQINHILIAINGMSLH